jgi:hypothetical protein
VQAASAHPNLWKQCDSHPDGRHPHGAHQAPQLTDDLKVQLYHPKTMELVNFWDPESQYVLKVHSPVSVQYLATVSAGAQCRLFNLSGSTPLPLEFRVRLGRGQLSTVQLQILHVPIWHVPVQCLFPDCVPPRERGSCR